ncbi:MAG TPA: ATP synthase F0 subunit B [Bryobacteraceae bacterium]|jgi:F-type H+-transporting ATPase subunit b|nr:ATP synthase F0 subunit B [Bryobacteraceae bacterium]
MRRFAQFGAVLFGFVLQVSAQESQAQETAALDAVTKWKILNTAIFAVLVGWFLWKFAPRFFNARSADIQKAIKDATGLKLEADYRYSEVDRKMASLAEEVKRMREQAQIEWDREHERLRKEAESDIAHIRQNVANEVEAFRLEGTQRLRRHTAELALQLAERRLRERFAQPGSGNLIDNFIHLVERGKN